MSYLFSIHEDAEIEIIEAVEFYDIESTGLGDIFVDEIQIAIDKISYFPYANPIIKGRIRKKDHNRFPYSLFYSIKVEEIRILAVAHHKRRPFYWVRRK